MCEFAVLALVGELDVALYNEHGTARSTESNHFRRPCLELVPAQI